METSDDYSILSIESVSIEDAGNYSCLATNEGSRVDHSSLLRVNGENERSFHAMAMEGKEMNP